MSQPQQLKGGDEDETVRSDRFAFDQQRAGVIDEEDRIVYQKRLPNELALILKELCIYQSSLEGIVVESTYNWY